MLLVLNIFTLLIISPYIFLKGLSERTKDNIYEKISSTTVCYRRLNATHQTGCSSKRGGSVGVIHYCEKIEDLNFILINGTSHPYIPVLPTKLFDVSILKTMINSQKVSGIILHSNNETVSHFTHEHQCPNPVSSMSGSCNNKSPWNPFGTGILYMDIPFPIFYVENEMEIFKMKNCFEKFNNHSYDTQNDRPLCSLELGAFMYATTNTPTCIRRSNIISNLNPQKFCDPLGDSNIWASLYPLVENADKRNETKPLQGYQYLVVAARLDTTSLFEKTAGANSPISGLVTLLSIASYLKRILTNEDVTSSKTNILFLLFNGETFDYIGSQRMLYDMLNDDFPVDGLGPNNNILPLIKPADIKLYVELSQMGNYKNNLYIHYLKEHSVTTKFLNYLKQNNHTIIFKNVPTSVPPSSLHTFLKNDPNFAGLVVTDHEKSYTNYFYNSLYDNSSNIQYVYMNVSTDDEEIFPKDSIQSFTAEIAEDIAKTLYHLVTNKTYTGVKNVSKIMVDELFHCYLEDPNCKLYFGTRGKTLPSTPLNLYVGVEHVAAHSTAFTAAILRWFTGDIVGDGNENCTNFPRNYAFKYYNMSQSLNELNITKCFRVTMNKTDAVSPAFKIPNYDWSSGQYSSWSESTWAEINMRMFLRTSSAHEKMTLAIGSMSVIFSFILVYFVKSRCHILFTESLPTEAPTNC